MDARQRKTTTTWSSRSKVIRSSQPSKAAPTAPPPIHRQAGVPREQVQRVMTSRKLVRQVPSFHRHSRIVKIEDSPLHIDIIPTIRSHVAAGRQLAFAAGRKTISRKSEVR